MSRTIVWLVAAGAAIIALALGVAWYTKMHERAALAPSVPSGAAPATPHSSAADKPAEPASQPSAAVMAPSFDVARIGRDQLEDYAKRRGLPIELAEKYLRSNVGY